MTVNTSVLLAATQCIPLRGALGKAHQRPVFVGIGVDPAPLAEGSVPSSGRIQTVVAPLLKRNSVRILFWGLTHSAADVVTVRDCAAFWITLTPLYWAIAGADTKQPNAARSKSFVFMGKLLLLGAGAALELSGDLFSRLADRLLSHGFNVLCHGWGLDVGG